MVTAEPLGLQFHTCIRLAILIFSKYRVIGLMSRVFANGLGDLGSIPSRVIPKTQKMVLDAGLLNTQHYKVRIKGKVEQSREWSSAPHYANIKNVKYFLKIKLKVKLRKDDNWFSVFFSCDKRKEFKSTFWCGEMVDFVKSDKMRKISDDILSLL